MCVCVSVCLCLSVCLSVSPHAILAVRAITSKTKDTIVLSVEKAFFLKTSGSKVRAFLLTSARTAILSQRAIYVQCFIYSLLHVHLCVTHTLSYYGDKGHLYVCGEGLAWIRGYSMCTRVRAQTLQHERQGKTLDYSPIEY